MKYTSRQVREVMSEAPTLAYLWGEVLELWEEIEKGDFQEARMELSDVAFFAHALLFERLGVSIPAIGAGLAMKKFMGRIQKWEEIFQLFVELKEVSPLGYLGGGSNYQKEHKRQRVLSSALGREVTPSEMAKVKEILCRGSRSYSP